ncbi:MAG TPA: 50S ribosomal protein L21 [Solirubrobacteraceae bacterium]|jgi:large subunit ribosomal protein L21
MYAIVKTGGKQYRVEEGQSLLVERLSADDGAKVGLEPLLYVDGSEVVDGDGLSRVKVEARIVGHERGPKLRVVKFKPKRGYKRRTGHRQELTRLEVTSVKLAAARSRSKAAASANPAAASEEKPVAAEEKPVAAAKKPAAAEKKPAAAEKKPAAKPAGDAPTTKPKTEDGDGA